MNLAFKLAWRNIFRQKRRSLLTILTMTGGFVLSSVSIGWMNGSYGNMIMFFTNHRTGQIQLHRTGYLDDPDIYSTIAEEGNGAILNGVEGVTAWAPRIYAGALLASRVPGSGSATYANSAGAAVIGIDPAMEENATGFSEQLTQGEMLSSSEADSMLFATGQILLGKELALLLDAAPGDSLVLFSQATDGSSADRKYVVRGIVSTGNATMDRSTSYITLGDAQLLFALEDRVHEMAVVTKSLSDVETVTERIAGSITEDSVSAEPWQVFAREFHNGMKADEVSLRITLGIIIGMAALGVLNTILMMVLERRREFGVMKAMGARPFRIVRMIVLEANILGILSVVLGCAASTLLLLYLSSHGLVLDTPLELGGFTFTEMKATIVPDCYWVPAIAVMLTASVVSLIPGVKAAHTDSAKSLRRV